MKLLAILPATLLAAAPALAGPYVNVENNSGFNGSNYQGMATDFHLGYEDGNGLTSWGVQAGPTVFSPDDGEAETKLTGKVFGSVAATRRLDVYGEISFVSDDTNSYGTKVGLKYKL